MIILFFCQERNKVIIANVIFLVTFAFSLYVNHQINRRRFISGWALIGLIDGISYWFLGSRTACYSCFYGAFRMFLITRMHREEKIIEKPLEAIVLNIPFVVISIYCIKYDGLVALIGVLNFFNMLLFMIKKDKTRIICDGLFDIAYLSYDLYYKAYASAIKYGVEITQYIINLIRISKNGESKYYKDKTNVIE